MHAPSSFAYSDTHYAPSSRPNSLSFLSSVLQIILSHDSLFATLRCLLFESSQLLPPESASACTSTFFDKPPLHLYQHWHIAAFRSTYIIILTLNTIGFLIQTLTFSLICCIEYGYSPTHHFICPSVYICTLHEKPHPTGLNPLKFLILLLSTADILISTSIDTKRGSSPVSTFGNTISIFRKSCALLFYITSMITKI